MRTRSPALPAVLALAVAYSAGCGAGSQAPMTVTLGTPRAEVRAELRRRDYCRVEGPLTATETYRLCEQPGIGLADSWVITRFDPADRLARLERYERYPVQPDAVRRWNQLVTARRDDSGPESPLARGKLRDGIGLPEGAVSWQSWLGAGGAIVSVFLLRPRSAAEPNVLEQIVPLPSEEAPAPRGAR